MKLMQECESWEASRAMRSQEASSWSLGSGGQESTRSGTPPAGTRTSAPLGWPAEPRSAAWRSSKAQSYSSSLLLVRKNLIKSQCIHKWMLAEQFVADGPRLQLYDFAEKHWEHLMNWQHATMYLFFGLAGTVSLVIHITEAAPLALDRLMLAIAFFNEGFLFLYHLHGRTMLDVHVHQLLLYAIFGDALFSFLEVFHRGNIILELLRCTLTLLQGSWFWQIGFVLYPPRGPEWDMKDHNNMMFVTMCYSWHLAFAMLIVGVLYCTVS
ncbi:hypothetical protein L3Q82_026002, partial [Scortum barcoo]